MSAAVAAGVTVTASPASADTFTFNAGSSAGVSVSSGGSGPTVTGHVSAGTPAAETTTIRLNASRTLISMNGFNLGPEDTLNLVFSSATDIVFFNALGSSPAVVAGKIKTFIGEVGGPVGGNVWLAGISGLSFASTADVEVGGLLATTNRDSGQFVAGTYVWLDAFFGVPPVVLSPGSTIVGHGGLLAFIAPTVQQSAEASVGGAPESGTEVLFASADSATMRLGVGTTGLELLDFTPAAAFMDGGRGPILAGATSAPDVYVVGAGTGFQSLELTGSIEATGAPADLSGNVVVSAGRALSRASGAEPIQVGTTRAGYYVRAQGPVTATREIVVAASSSVSLLTGTRLTAPVVALSAGDTVHNTVGSAAVDVGEDGQWVVYLGYADFLDRPLSAPDTLDSGNPAIWGSDLAGSPPSELSGNRYVVRQPPTITVTADDVQKPYGVELTTFHHSVTGAHLGKPGFFTADETPSYTGAPVLTSAGGAADARALRTGPYPVVVQRGDLTSSIGSRFVLVDGELTVTDSSPAAVTALITGPTGDGGWYTGDVTVDWSVVEPQSYTDPEDCADVRVTSDQPETTYTCAVTGPGGDASGTVSVGRDTTPPVLTVDGLQGTAPYTSASWSSGDVVVDYTCTDLTSGVASQTDDIVATVSGDYPASCTDVAGHTTTVPFRVNIDTADPVLGALPADQSLTTTGDSATATWTTPTATDSQDTAVDVVCTPGSGSSFPVGTTVVTCTATDHAGNTDSATFTVTVTQHSATATFDRPIGSAPVMSIARLGRVITVRATVTADGTTVTGPSAQPVHLGVSSGINCSIGSTTDVIEDFGTGSSASSNLMQWDATAQRWAFRLNTGAFAVKPNACYRVSVYYGGTVVGDRASGGVLAGTFYVRTKK